MGIFSGTIDATRRAYQQIPSGTQIADYYRGSTTVSRGTLLTSATATVAVAFALGYLASRYLLVEPKKATRGSWWRG